MVDGRVDDGFCDGPSYREYLGVRRCVKKKGGWGVSRQSVEKKVTEDQIVFFIQLHGF